MTVVRPPSIPFGWKVIPQTADAASVTLRVNLECLCIHFAVNGYGSRGEKIIILASIASVLLPFLFFTPIRIYHIAVSIMRTQKRFLEVFLCPQGHLLPIMLSFIKIVSRPATLQNTSHLIHTHYWGQNSRKDPCFSLAAYQEVTKIKIWEIG